MHCSLSGLKNTMLVTIWTELTLWYFALALDLHNDRSIRTDGQVKSRYLGSENLKTYISVKNWTLSCYAHCSSCLLLAYRREIKNREIVIIEQYYLWFRPYKIWKHPLPNEKQGRGILWIGYKFTDCVELSIGKLVSI